MSKYWQDKNRRGFCFWGSIMAVLIFSKTDNLELCSLKIIRKIQFKTVRILNLSDNVIESIPESLEKMSMLKKLDVSGNRVRFWPKVSQSLILIIKGLSLDYQKLRKMAF